MGKGKKGEGGITKYPFFFSNFPLPTPRILLAFTTPIRFIEKKGHVRDFNS